MVKNIFRRPEAQFFLYVLESTAQGSVHFQSLFGFPLFILFEPFPAFH